MYNKKIAFILICCLVQLFLCHYIDSERISDGDDSIRLRHPHRRRSLKYGSSRFLGFHFIEEPQNTIATVDNYAILHCKYDFAQRDAADVRLEWRKDGQAINSIRPVGRILVLSNGSLTIEETIPADEGVYQCVVHVTPHASHVTWTYLSRRSVLSLPSLQRFEHQPTNRKAYLGQFVAFRCILEFRPSAEIEWYHNDRRIHESNGYSFVPLSHTLTISNINHKHAGNYKCIARNGNKERTSQVAHLDVSDGDNGAISFALEPRGQVITSGESFILECLVNGHPKPRVRWLHASSPVVEDGSHIKRVGADRTSLLIEKSGSQDGGVYTCRAENGDDSIDASATISIRIPPTITALPKEQVMQETTDVEFECKTIGDPKPRVTWYKNGETIIPSEYFMTGIHLCLYLTH